MTLIDFIRILDSDYDTLLYFMLFIVPIHNYYIKLYKKAAFN